MTPAFVLCASGLATGWLPHAGTTTSLDTRMRVSGAEQIRLRDVVLQQALYRADGFGCLHPGLKDALPTLLASRHHNDMFGMGFRGICRCRVRCCTEDDTEADRGPLSALVWASLLSAVDEEADELGLCVESMRFSGGKLSVLASGGGIDEIQTLNSRVSAILDNADDPSLEALPPFLLEVSSPGISNELDTDLDFTTWKGFEVLVTLSEEYKKKTEFAGSLVGRDADHVTLNLRGRMQKIPRALVAQVRLPSAKTEPGDRN